MGCFRLTIDRSGSRFAVRTLPRSAAVRIVRGHMLYDAYQAQNDIFGPIRLMAGTASEWLGHALAVDRRPALCARRRRRDGTALPCRAVASSGRISASTRSRSTARRSRSARRSSPRIRSATCSISARNLTREEPTRAGRGAAFRPFRDPAARHGRDPAGRSRRLPDRLGQRARRAAAATAGSISTILSSW